MKRIAMTFCAIAAITCAHSSIAKQPASKSKPSEWLAEPASVIGITPGQPLPDSVQVCPRDYNTSYPDFQRIHEGQLCVVDKTGEISDVWGTPNLGFNYKTTIFRKGDAVSSIWLTLDSDSYDVAVSLLTKKYGAPTKVAKDTVQTKAGGQFDNTTVEWVGRKLSIRAIQRFDKVDQSIIMVNDLALQAQELNAIKAQSDDAASKL